jgi:general secretion pathway protein A
VLVIDEAQSLPADVLEQLRLLTNLETSERKLLQIVLIGQPELRDMLARPDLEQLAQRVIARYHLGALTAGETQQYIRHRFAVAGAKAPLPFSKSALQRIHELAGGVPRRINLLADRALLGAYAQGHTRVERRTVVQAAREVFGRATAAAPAWAWAAGGALAVVAAGAAVWALWPAPGRQRAPVAPLASAPASAVAASAAASPAASAPTTPAFDSAEALLAAAQPQPAIAWRELALRWNVAIGEGDPCVAAAQARLACFRSPTGGLALLRQVSRPAVLALRAPRGPALHAVLVALDDSSATLQAGGRNFRLPLQTLLDLWRGDVATFWRVPPGWREGSELSADPQGRRWLSEKLGAAGHGGERPLLERVWAFQLAQGLPLDGLAGPLTLMQLNRAVGVDEPRLTPSR